MTQDNVVKTKLQAIADMMAILTDNEIAKTTEGELRVRESWRSAANIVMDIINAHTENELDTNIRQALTALRSFATLSSSHKTAVGTPPSGFNADYISPYDRFFIPAALLLVYPLISYLEAADFEEIVKKKPLLRQLFECAATVCHPNSSLAEIWEALSKIVKLYWLI